MRPVRICDQLGERPVDAGGLVRLAAACTTDRWEVEIGFGKGRFLLSQAASDPDVQWLGIEIAAKYYRLACARVAGRGLSNVHLLCGEAGYILASMLPAGFASRLHVYFPDPWPKERHARRRLFDPDNFDLLLALLRPGGEVLFATDHPQYGASVEELLSAHPSLAVESMPAWNEGPRTNYENKFVARGMQIRRLSARLIAADLRHPLATPLQVALPLPRLEESI